VKLSDEDIADFEVLRDNHFWLCIYWVHIIGATWRIRLNRPCAAAMQAYVKLLSSLVIPVAHDHDSEDCYVLVVLFILKIFFSFCPFTDFLTSLGRFS